MTETEKPEVDPDVEKLFALASWLDMLDPAPCEMAAHLRRIAERLVHAMEPTA